MVVLNKADLIDAARLEAVRSNVAGQTDRALKIVHATQGRLPADVLLGLDSATEDQIALRKSHHEMEHEDGIDHDHDHDEFESFVAETGAISDPNAFVAGLKEIIARHDVLRLKGFIDVPGKPMRLVVQAVGQRIETYFDRPWRPGEDRSTKLVVIGLHDIDQTAIGEAIAAAAGRAAAA